MLAARTCVLALAILVVASCGRPRRTSVASSPVPAEFNWVRAHVGLDALPGFGLALSLRGLRRHLLVPVSSVSAAE
jgi:hypothetical protein